MQRTLPILLAIPLFVGCEDDSSSPSDPGSGGSGGSSELVEHYLHETDINLDFPNGCTCSAPNLGELIDGHRWTIEGVVGHMWTQADTADGFKFSGSEDEAFLIEYTLVPMTNSSQSDLDLIAPGFYAADDEFPVESAVETGSFTVDAQTDELGMKIQNAEIDSEWRLVFTVTSIAPVTEEPVRRAPVRVLWISPEGDVTCTTH